MFNFVYPTATEILEINQDLESRGEADRLGLKLFPRKARSTLNVAWWQKDNDFGRMQFRGLDGQAPKVQRLGFNRFDYEAGVYGEHVLLTETEYMKRANLMDNTMRIPMGDFVTEGSRQLIAREMDRMESNVFTLLSTGTLNIPLPGPNGVLGYTDTYNIQTYTATNPWTNLSQATPIADMQNIQQKSVGHSGRFDASSTMYVNQQTANALINNSNANDLDGRRGMYGVTLNNLPAISSYFQGQNLPGIKVYDEGYQVSPLSGPETAPLTTAGATNQFQKFIPNHIGILVGNRPNGETVGEYQITANSAAGNQSVSYTYVADYFNGINAPKTIPGKVEVYRLTNGGPALFYPYSILSASI